VSKECFGVTAGGVDERHRKIIGREDQGDLGAAKDNGIDAITVEMPTTDLQVGLAKFGCDLPCGELWARLLIVAEWRRA